MQFSGEQLSDPDLLRIWEAYDVNGDGRMDREELAFLMEDLCEVLKKRRRCFRSLPVPRRKVLSTGAKLCRVRDRQHWGPPGSRGIPPMRFAIVVFWLEVGSSGGDVASSIEPGVVAKKPFEIGVKA